MSRIRIQERGQVTLPKTLREQAGLAPGDTVTITASDGGLMIRRAPSIFEYRLPTLGDQPPDQPAENRAWADAAGADPANHP